MSDIMLFGVLRMPFEMAMGDDIARRQYWQRGQQAANEIERLRNELHIAQEWSARVIAGHEQDIAEITALRAENERLRVQNIQMQAALGYGIMAEDERHILPSNPYKCGTCDANKHIRAENERLRAALRKADEELAANGYRDTQWPRPDIRAALEEKP